MENKFLVTLPGKAERVTAFNPLTAAIKAFPDSFEMIYLYDVHVFMVTIGIYIVSLRSETMGCVITVEEE